jgi:cobalt-zinc-cadmium efflux system outer membrane protein
MLKCLSVVVWAIAILVWNQSSLIAAEVTLDQAVEIAVEKNPDLAAAANELLVARGEIQRANYISQFNPQLTGGFDYRARSEKSNSQDWRTGLSHELEIFGQRGLRQQSAKLGYQRTEAEVRNQVRLLTAAVKMTFYEALRARNRSKLLTELEELNHKLADAARTRFDAGEIGQIDFNLARVRYGESRSALIAGTEIYRLECSNLGRLLGNAVGAEPEPVGDLIAKPLHTDIEKLLDQTKANRADLKAAQTEIRRLQTEAQLNGRLVLPNPTIGAFVGHEQITERFAGVTLGIPLPIFNRRQGEAIAIAGRLSQARNKLRAIEMNVEHEVRDAYGRYTAALRALKANQDDVVAPARESFGLLEAAFNAGKLDLLSLSVAERQSFDAQMGYLDAWFNYAAAKTSLDLAVGDSA